VTQAGDQQQQQQQQQQLKLGDKSGPELQLLPRPQLPRSGLRRPVARAQQQHPAVACGCVIH
jgi:hypothetical protein